MKNRIIAIITIVITLCTSVLSFGGCSSNIYGNVTLGQWLGMINNSFGMDSYIQEEPYFEEVGKNNSYFNTVQIAAEWDVIDKDDDINPEAFLTWEEALITLINVGNFMPLEASDDEKIQYAIDNFDTSIRKYWMNRTIKVSDATELLLTAHEQWAGRKYTTPVEKITYADNVEDLSAVDNTLYYFENDTVVLAPEISENLEWGDIFILPDEITGIPTAYKVVEITKEDGKTIIVTDTDLELNEIVEEVYIEETSYVDLSSAAIYDGNGNLIQKASKPQSLSNQNDSDSANSLVYFPDSQTTSVQTAVKTEVAFKTPEGFEIAAEFQGSDITFKVEGPIGDSETLKWGFEASVSDIEVTRNIDYFVTLKSAEVKVDYKATLKGGVKKNFVKKEIVRAPDWTNGNGKFLTNFKNSIWKDSQAKGAKTIKVLSAKIASVGVASLSLDISFKFNVDGTVELILTENGSKGVEYSKGKCRVINNTARDFDVEFKCKAEAMLSFGPMVNLFGKAMIGAKADVGLGATGSLTLHLADYENHLLAELEVGDVPLESFEYLEFADISTTASEIQAYAEANGASYTMAEAEEPVKLKFDPCVDISIYFILRVGLEEETLAGKLLKGTSVKVSWELCGSSNAKLLNIHWDKGGFFVSPLDSESKCTYVYASFAEEAIEDEAPEGNMCEFGEVLIFSSMKLVLTRNQNHALDALQLPVGYTKEDLVYESSDASIATVDSNGVISAIGEGTTTIIITTKDGKYSYAVSVTVTEPNDDTIVAAYENIIVL